MELNDKKIRKELIHRYMDAETTVAEEQLLAEYYASHCPEPEERVFARLAHATAPHPMTEDEATSKGGEAEFDKIMMTRTSSGWKPWWIITAAAAAVLLAILLWKPSDEPEFTPLEIAESLTTLSELGISDIESLTARPMRSKIVVTATLKDGETASFIMGRSTEDGTIQLLSME